jgi:hypothetical protein
MKSPVLRSRGFCRLFLATILPFMGADAISAQVVIPATPKKFTKRMEGSGGANIGPGLAPATPNPPPVVRTITYYALSDSRQWTSTDGKPLLAKLVAFEEAVVETQGAQTQAAPPPRMPANPTVVRDGKARLLSGKVAYEIPLERLSQGDRDFIEGIRTAAAASKNTAPSTPASAEKKE